MSKFLALERCPRCEERGADRRGDNLATYSDGGAHCFSCGYYRPPTFRLNYLIKEEPKSDKEKIVLPSDFQRSIPTEGWKWLLQYGLSYSHWQAHCGFTPRENRLIFTVGIPTRFSIGRLLTSPLPVGASKWKVYGDKSSYVEVVSEQLSGEIVLVEDLISAHKVAASGHTCIPLFGTNVHDGVMKKLQELKRPVALWLDEDQYTHLPKKMGRLQALLEAPVRHIKTRKDPKGYTTQEIGEILL